MSEHDQEVQEVQENVQEVHRPVPRLNERILSSLSRRSVAAHPWHDLEIGTILFIFIFPLAFYLLHFKI